MPTGDAQKVPAWTASECAQALMPLIWSGEYCDLDSAALATLCWVTDMVVFQTWFSYQNSEFVSIDKETDDDVMHLVEFGETNRLPC